MKRTPLALLLAGIGAVLASACCWLPALLVGAGLAGVGFAATLEAACPWLLGVSALFVLAAVVVSFRRHRPRRWATLVVGALVLGLGFAPLGGARGPAGTSGGDACCTVPPSGAEPSASAEEEAAFYVPTSGALDQLGCCTSEEEER